MSVNRDIAIKQLPTQILANLEQMLRAGKNPYEAARFVLDKGYMEDLSERSLAKAIERYRKNNAARLLPDPVLIVADQDDALQRVTEVIKAPGRHPASYVQKMIDEVAEDINELSIMVWLVLEQQKRVAKSLLLEEPMSLPLETTDKQIDRLMRLVKDAMKAKQNLGILPQRPGELRVWKDEMRLNVDVGADDLIKMLMHEMVSTGLASEAIEAESPADTKSRIREDLIEGEIISDEPATRQDSGDSSPSS